MPTKDRFIVSMNIFLLSLNYMFTTCLVFATCEESSNWICFFGLYNQLAMANVNRCMTALIWQHMRCCADGFDLFTGQKEVYKLIKHFKITHVDCC